MTIVQKALSFRLREIWGAMLWQVSFKHCVAHHIDPYDVIQNGITERFELLVVARIGQLEETF